MTSFCPPVDLSSYRLTYQILVYLINLFYEPLLASLQTIISSLPLDLPSDRPVVTPSWPPSVL
jgi:hypothetical protein